MAPQEKPCCPNSYQESDNVANLVTDNGVAKASRSPNMYVPIIQPPASTNGTVGNKCKCKCDCNCCTDKNKSSQTKKYCKYVQPDKSISYKPELVYVPPKTKFDNRTVYNNSYLQYNTEKAESFKPTSNLCTGEGKMTVFTTNNLSYKEYKNIPRTAPIIPCKRSLLGTGPVQDLTTHKHDYVPKPISKMQTFRPTVNFTAIDAPLSDKTINRLSYAPVNTIQAKGQSFRPVNELKAQSGKFETNTVHRLSFLPWQLQGPVEKPWANKVKYVQPTLTMSDDTCYRKSYTTPLSGDYRQPSFKQQNSFVPPTLKMDGGTVYQKSYTPCKIEKTESIRPPTNQFSFGEGKMSDQTIHKASFQPHINVVPTTPMIPCRRKYVEDAPMQDLTTHKHDYVSKYVSKTQSFKPVQSLQNSDEPMSDKTINRISYMPYDLKDVRVLPTRTCDSIQKSKGKFEINTVHKLSYRPWELSTPVDKPWADRAKYAPPQLRMEGNTVHSLSFRLPGTYVECSADDPDCIPCPELECESMAFSDTKLCCSECCCQLVECQ